MVYQNEFAGFTIDMPFGPAAGAINGPNVNEVKSHTADVLRSIAGFGMIGSICMNRRIGNANFGRTYSHNPKTGETVNSMGLPNIGIEELEKVLPALVSFAEDHGKPLGVSVSPAPGEDPTVVLPELVERAFLAGAHFVEGNYSCPNKITEDGGREPILGYDREMTQEVRGLIAGRIGTGQNFGEKWPAIVPEYPDIMFDLAADLSNGSEKDAVYYVSAPNTVRNIALFDEKGMPVLDVPKNLGGLSGPATSAMSRTVLKHLDLALPSGVKRVSCGGIIDGVEVFERTHDLGATLSAGVTLFFENETRGISYGQTAQTVGEEYIDTAARMPYPFSGSL